MEWMEAIMVEVTFKTVKQIVIHEAIEHELRNFVKIRLAGVGREAVASPFMWAEGVVFSRSSPPPTEEVVKQLLEGVIHFTSIGWALMPKYKRYLKSGGATIPVINASDNPNLRDVAKALKRTRKKSK
jgi:hypothetical protein